MPTDLRLLRGSVPGGAAHELAVTHALLRHVAAGHAPATLRLYRPDPTVAFGRLDTLRPGYGEAVVAARAAGFDPAVRAPGGRAAAYHRDSLVVELVAPVEDHRTGIRSRFEAMSGLVVRSLSSLGVAARIGELPDEYCPGAWSVIAGELKLGGVAQKVIGGAALVGIAIVVRDGESIRSVLAAVSRALDYAFDPATAGALDEVLPGASVEDVEGAIERAFAIDHRLVPVEAEAALLASALELEPGHRQDALTRRG